MIDLNTSWERLWRGLGAHVDGTHLRDDLIARYSAPSRKYHTLQHLSECIAWLECITEQAQHPAEIEAALWFHDAIYELKRDDNEERSACLAVDSLLGGGVPPESVLRVERLILVTKHIVPPLSLDEQFIVDIDLSIFGASEQRFAEYEQQIREEYASIPVDSYRLRRQEILSLFLNRRRIYTCDYFHSRLEEQARANLLHAITTNGG